MNYHIIYYFSSTDSLVSSNLFRDAKIQPLRSLGAFVALTNFSSCFGVLYADLEHFLLASFFVNYCCKALDLKRLPGS